MSQFGEYKELWEHLKQNNKILVKPTGVTIDKLRRSISKEKDEDPDLKMKMLRLKRYEKLNDAGIGTGYYYIELVPIENKTRSTTVTKLFKAMDK